jgi:hypothetical protein
MTKFKQMYTILETLINQKIEQLNKEMPSTPSAQHVEGTIGYKQRHYSVRILKDLLEQLKTIKPETGLDMVIHERRRHFELGFDTDHDLKCNNDEQLLNAAQGLIDHKYGYIPDEWDEELVNNMMSKPRNERLAIAASLIIAEIDRCNGAEGDEGHERTRKFVENEEPKACPDCGSTDRYCDC